MKRMTMTCLSAVALFSCSKKANNEVVDSDSPPRGDLTAFADIDGLIVRPGIGGFHVLNPRSNTQSELYDWADGRDAAGSPDGRHFATSSADGTRLIIAELGLDGDLPSARIVHDVAVARPQGVAVDPSGTWAYTQTAAVEIESGELFDCDGAGANLVMPFPDGEHLLLDCDPPTIYRNGEVVWRGAFVFGNTLEEGVNPKTPSADGDWILNSDFKGSPSAFFHLPTRTTVLSEDPVLGVVLGGLAYAGVDPAGRIAVPPAGVIGATCEYDGIAPTGQGYLTDAIGLLTGDALFPRVPLELGSSGPFFDIPDDGGEVVRFLGFSGDGKDALYVGRVYGRSVAIEDTIGGGRDCEIYPIETHIRRVPIAGGAPVDVAVDFVPGEGCSELPSEARYPWDPAPLALAGPDNSLICLSPQGGVVVTRDDAYIVPWAGTVVSPGRRASVSSRRLGPPDNELGVCYQRLDDPDIAVCTEEPLRTDAVGEFTFWGGWAVPGAGGFNGTSIYRVSRLGAPAGGEVRLFGAGFGDSGQLSLGDFMVPGSAVVSWTDTEIRFSMPEGAPDVPAEVRVNGTNNAATRTVFRKSEYLPTLDLPERVTAAYGRLFIPSSTPNLEGIVAGTSVGPPDDFSGAPGPGAGGVRVVEGGIEMDIPTSLVPGTWWTPFQLGRETRTVAIEIGGSTAQIGDEWTRLQDPVSGFPVRGQDVFLETAEGVVLRTVGAIPVLLPEGRFVDLVDGENALAGTWTHGPFDPYVLRDDGTIEQLTGFDVQGEEATAVFMSIGALSTGLQTARAATPDRGFAVVPTAGRGVLFTSAADGSCGAGPCRIDYQFDLATGDGTLLPQLPYSAPVDVAGTTAAGLHFLDSVSVVTLSADAADFATPRPAETLSPTTQILDTRFTTWGAIGRDDRFDAVYVALRSDAAAGFVDLGLTDVIALGVSRDGSRAVLGTSTGDVYLISEADPMNPVAIEPVQVVDGVSDHILITDDGLLAWFEPANTGVHLRKLPQ